METNLLLASVADVLWRLRLYACHVDVVTLKHAQCIIEHSRLSSVFESEQNGHIVIILPEVLAFWRYLGLALHRGKESVLKSCKESSGEHSR